MYVRDLASLGEKEFFICFSMTVMGLVTVIEWEMLFPDRRDYANLTPLPIRLRTMFGAKIAALLAFLTIFSLGHQRIFAGDVSGRSAAEGIRVDAVPALPAVTSSAFWPPIRSCSSCASRCREF